MQIEITSKRAGVLCAFGLALTLSGGVAWGQGRETSPATAKKVSSAFVIVACAKTDTGAMRLSTQSQGCVSGEKLISWNVAGPAGAAGAAGAAGPEGKPGISGYEVVQYGSGFESYPSTSVTCPSGKKVLSGGFDTEAAGHPGIRDISGSAVASFPPNTTQWFVKMKNFAGQGGRDIKVQAYAICAFVAG